jgi:hypothetical protein
MDFFSLQKGPQQRLKYVLSPFRTFHPYLFTNACNIITRFTVNFAATKTSRRLYLTREPFKMKQLTLLATILLLIQSAFSQENQVQEIKTKKMHGTFFFSWGYHRDNYSKSTIKFKDSRTDHYDFTLYDARAKDQPDWNNFFKTPLTVPQYVMTGGYFFNDKKDLGIEVSWNHLKYVVRDNQMMHLRGTINEVYYDQDTLVTPDFVHFEHTNGNNYLIISLLKRVQLVQSHNGNHKLSANFRFGGGALIPKTDSYIMGKHNDGPFRLSGYVIGTGAALRYDFFKYFFIEPSFKLSFANYTDAKLYLTGRAKHHFLSEQYILALGFNVPSDLFRRNNSD